MRQEKTRQDDESAQICNFIEKHFFTLLSSSSAEDKGDKHYLFIAAAERVITKKNYIYSLGTLFNQLHPSAKDGIRYRINKADEERDPETKKALLQLGEVIEKISS